MIADTALIAGDPIGEPTSPRPGGYWATGRASASPTGWRRWVANRAKAFAKFMATPFLPGYNLDRLERQWDAPVPPNPSLGIDDDRWREGHRAMMYGQEVATHADR